MKKLSAFLIAMLVAMPVLAGSPTPTPSPAPKKPPAFSTMGLKPIGLHFHIVLRDKTGKVLAVRDPADLDLITTAGATALINDTFNATGFTSAWYMGEILQASTPTFVIADTMTSHGWTGERTSNQDITNATRPSILPIGSPSGTTNVTATGAACVFTQNSSATLQGFYIVSDNTVGGTAGILYGEMNFPSFSVVATNSVTITVSIITPAG